MRKENSTTIVDFEVTKMNNSHEIEEIVKAIVDRRLIIFIGAGVSIGVGMPSWKELLNKILEKVTPSKKYLPKEKWITTSLIRKALKDDDFVSVGTLLKKIFTDDNAVIDGLLTVQDGHKNNIGASEVIDYLAQVYKLGGDKIVTTNYDGVIEYGLDYHKIEKKLEDYKCYIPYDEIKKEQEHGVIFKNFQENVRDGKPFIVKLHGEKHPVFDGEDYSKLYGNDDYQKILNTLFTSHIILFIGYSFSKDKLYEYIEKKGLLQGYAIIAENNNKKEHEEQISKLNTIGISPIILTNGEKEEVGVVYKNQLKLLLNEIVVKTEEKLKERFEKLLSNKIDFDIESAKEFFDETAKAVQCIFFNTQIDFKQWFTPALQLHLSLQKAAFRTNKLGAVANCMNNCFDESSWRKNYHNCKEMIPSQTQGRIIFIPYTKCKFQDRISKEPILRLNIEALYRVHQLTSCSLAIVTSEQLASIIKKQKIEDKTKKDEDEKLITVKNLEYLGLSKDIYENDDILRYIERDIKNQNINNSTNINDIDFAYLEKRVSNGEIEQEIWEADIIPEEDGNGSQKLTYFKSLNAPGYKGTTEAEVRNRCYIKFSEFIIRKIFCDVSRKDLIENNGDIARFMNPQFSFYEKCTSNQLLEVKETLIVREKYDVYQMIKNDKIYS